MLLRATALVFCLLAFGHAAQFNLTDSCNRPPEADNAALAALLQLVPPLPPLKSDNDECRLHSRLFHEELQEMKMWALKMYDSNSKIGSSLLNGNLVHLGDFDQCVSVLRSPEQMGGGPRVRGRYCAVSIYLEPVGLPKKWRELHSIIDLMKSHSAMSNEHQNNDLHLPTFSPVQLGFCIPDSCGHQDLEKSILEFLRPINITSGIDFKVKIGENSCRNGDANSMDIWTAITVLFVASLLLFALIGTHHEKAHTAEDGSLLPTATKGTFNRLLLAFSFRRNWRSLVDTDVPEDELSCLHGMRFIASLMIYIIHKVVFILFHPFSNRTDVANLLEGDWTMIFRAFWNWVDAFVIMSGLLTSFYAFKKLKAGQRLNIPKMYFQRYLKFTPMVFVWSLMLQNLMQHQISGPNLIRIVGPYIDNCKRGLLPVLTYTSVFDGLNKMCYPPAHQLVTDMHMYIMAPFIMMGIWKYPKKAPAALLAVVVALGAMKYSTVMKNDLGSFLFYGMSTETTVRSANAIYVNALHRLTPYLMGLSLGYILQITECKRVLSRVQMAAGTAIAIGCATYAMFGVSHTARKGYIYQVSEAAVFATFQPLMWGFALCWLVYCCATKQAPCWLRRFLTWRGFLVYSRLSYAIYLTQLYVVAVNVGNAVDATRFGVHRIFDLNDIALVGIISLLSTLILLLPLQDVSTLISGGYKPPNYSKYIKPVGDLTKEVSSSTECLVEAVEE
ncbi:nose resistant to fluoxetine protein 6-like [Neocloeon triangulifer]|uniref:nose resistant to fluoxetine protein 6-like n=1 Tax=Neocloeon triangulifer TaxID=2078957 RepID=UPI00286F7D27|nr:nose resistant to fluoxetine protein 6-like [Neocloeon triangulifer]